MVGGKLEERRRTRQTQSATKNANLKASGEAAAAAAVAVTMSPDAIPRAEIQSDGTLKNLKARRAQSMELSQI